MATRDPVARSGCVFASAPVTRPAPKEVIMSHTEEPAPTSARSTWASAALFVLCGIAAVAVVRRLVALFIPAAAAGPPQMATLDAAFASRTILTTVHIVPALLFVLLLPAWFSRSVRDRISVHRRITHALFLLGAVTGITALPLSLHPIGGINEAAAALLYDSFFLFLSPGPGSCSAATILSSIAPG
jgi:hypothetical protein